jgi:two-component system, cell cycle response regulator DivK
MTLILVVDDVADNRDVTSHFLRFSKYEVIEAVEGEEALRIARERLPDVIIMDLALPRMSGFEATRRLKDDPRTKHIPVIALTATSDIDGEERARESGCVRYLVKPCPHATLARAIRECLPA